MQKRNHNTDESLINIQHHHHQHSRRNHPYLQKYRKWKAPDHPPRTVHTQ